MLAQYANSSEGYLFWARGDGLHFAASLDERSPPDGLELLLSRVPANDTGTVDLEDGELTQRYNVFPLRADDTRVGLAVLSDSNGELPELPSALLREIGEALHAALPRNASQTRR